MAAKKMFKNGLVLFSVFFLLAACSVKGPVHEPFNPMLAATETGATTAYKRTLLTGGTFEALDSIDGAGLLANDFAFVLLGGTLYTYNYKNYGSTQTESSPDIIVPDANPSTFAWQLQEQPGANIITSDTTLYLSPTGNDTTGDGTASTPWYSLEKAFDYLKDKWINTDVTVTISIAAGTYTGLSTVTITHHQASNVEIVGAGKTTTILTFTVNGIIIDGVVLRSMQDFTIAGPGGFAGTGVELIHATVEIEAVKFSAWGAGVFASKNSFMQVSSSSFFNFANGIIIEDSSTLFIDNTDLDGNSVSGTYGIKVFSSGIVKTASTITLIDMTYGCYAYKNSFIDASGVGTNTATTPYSPTRTTSDVEPTWGNYGSWILDI